MSAPDEARVGAGDNGLVYALKERVPRLAMAYAIGSAMWPLGKRVKDWWEERTEYNITVKEGDEVYLDLHEWVLSQIPTEKRRALIAYSSSNGRLSKPVNIEGDEDDPAPQVRFRYSGSREQTVTVGGHTIKVSVTDGSTARENGMWYQAEPGTIEFTVSSSAARDAVQGKLDSLLKERHTVKRRPSLRIARTWGDWQRQDELPRRSLESVVLADGQMDRMIADLDQFLKAESEYNRRYISWHRGYLFEGPAGTGKTSIAKALANHFGLDVWYLPLGDIHTGATLMSLVSEISPRSMLLIEDIDVIHAASSREDDGELNLSDLLNALDGIATPHGLITVMTTNAPEVLDSALVRPGRVDRQEHFGHAGPDQTRRLFEWFYDEEWPGNFVVPRKTSPAEVVGIMHRNASDSTEAARAIEHLKSVELTQSYR